MISNSCEPSLVCSTSPRRRSSKLARRCRSPATRGSNSALSIRPSASAVDQPADPRRSLCSWASTAPGSAPRGRPLRRGGGAARVPLRSGPDRAAAAPHLGRRGHDPPAPADQHHRRRLPEPVPAGEDRGHARLAVGRAGHPRGRRGLPEVGVPSPRRRLRRAQRAVRRGPRGARAVLGGRAGDVHGPPLLRRRQRARAATGPATAAALDRRQQQGRSTAWRRASPRAGCRSPRPPTRRCARRP